MNAKDLLETMDADVWAKEFIRIRNEQADPLNIDVMRAWFANSIMCGYDHSRWKLEKQIESIEKKLEIAKTIIDNYGTHQNQCILAFWEAGEPTTDGGYRSKYAGKWYQSKPVDETPKCNCGFIEDLREIEK